MSLVLVLVLVLFQVVAAHEGCGAPGHDHSDHSDDDEHAGHGHDSKSLWSQGENPDRDTEITLGKYIHLYTFNEQTLSRLVCTYTINVCVLCVRKDLQVYQSIKMTFVYLRYQLPLHE